MKQDFSNYETEELVLKYQATQDEAALQEILIRNKGLFCKWAYQYRNIPNCEEEDLIEKLYVACWKAVESFDPASGYSFTTCLKGFALRQLNRLYNEATRQKRYNGSTSVSYEGLAEINREGGSEGDRYFTVEAPELSEIELREFLDSIGGTLEKVAVMLLNGDTKSEIARALKCSNATITYYVRRLRKAYTAFYAEG